MTKWLKLMLCIRFPPNVTRVTTLNADVLNFLPNTGFITIRLLRFGVKVKRVYCRGNTARH